MNDLGLNIHMRGSYAEGFDGVLGLYGFLNTLFRADEAQMLTNEYSAYNVALFPMAHGLGAVHLEDLDQRKRVLVMAKQLLSAHAGGDVDNLETDVTYFKLTDDSDRLMSDVSAILALDDRFFKNVSGFILPNKEDLARCLFHVVHVDQEDRGFHIHSVKIKQ